MHREGHVGAALLAYAPVGTVTLALGFERLALLGGALAVGLATLPDYDLRVPLLPHRGPTHTVWFALVVGGFFGAFGWLVGSRAGPAAAAGLAAFGFASASVAIGSHILADAVTPAGVRPFAPLWNRRYSYGLVRASSWLANYALLAVGLLAATGAFAVGDSASAVAGLDDPAAALEEAVAGLGAD